MAQSNGPFVRLQPNKSITIIDLFPFEDAGSARPDCDADVTIADVCSFLLFFSSVFLFCFFVVVILALPTPTQKPFNWPIGFARSFPFGRCWAVSRGELKINGVDVIVTMFCLA